MLNLEGTKSLNLVRLSLFLASILYYFAIITGGGDSTLSNVLLSVAFVIVGFGFTCYSAAMLPFITDQIIGATSDELSAVVRWYYWARYLGNGLSTISVYFCRVYNLENVCVGFNFSLCYSSCFDHHQ